MLNRSKLLAAALLAAVFAAGAAVGAAVFAPRDNPAEARERHDGGRGGPRERSREHSYIGWLVSELSLSPGQRDTVERILEGYQGAMREISTEVRPRVDSIRARIRGEIAGVLDSAQQERYKVLTARSDSSRRAERQRDSIRNAKREGTRDK